MVIDPVCGMRIAEASAAATSHHEGRTYHFCSALCKQVFDRDPGKYTQAENKTEKPS
jgi:Cu+-exporting ATPase